MILTFRPIKVWPPDWNRSDLWRPDSPFTATYSDTLIVLERELDHLGAKDLLLQVDATDRDCRLDGQLRADAKVNHPGVILSFTSRNHGALSYPCDAYQRRTYGSGARIASWQHNLRAVALGLEALRKVERYGIAQRGQQYAGYRELGSGPIELGAAMSVEGAAKTLGDAAGEAWEDLLAAVADGDRDGYLDVCFRQAAKTHHPDAGGDPEAFRLVMQARDVLREHAR